MERPGGFLKERDFQSLLDDLNTSVAVLMFYFMGEPFLNPHAYDMIRYARKYGIFVESCTNGDFVDVEGILYSDINQISFQIGGLSNSTHQVYRVRSDINRIRDNIERLVERRNSLQRSNVQIEVGFIVMRHNEHEVQAFIEWCRELGVDKANVIDPCVRDIKEGEQFLTDDPRYWFYDREAFDKGILRPKIIPNNECSWIWNSAVVNWNGSMVPCCRDPHGRHGFGNVFEEGFDNVWNGPKARSFRRSILREQSSVDICKLCSGYGLPLLGREKVASFEVARHSVDQSKIEALQKEAMSDSVRLPAPERRSTRP